MDPKIIIEVIEGAPAPGTPSAPEQTRQKEPDGQQQKTASDQAREIEQKSTEVKEEVRRQHQPAEQENAVRETAQSVEKRAGNVANEASPVARQTEGTATQATESAASTTARSVASESAGAASGVATSGTSVAAGAGAATAAGAGVAEGAGAAAGGMGAVGVLGAVVAPLVAVGAAAAVAVIAMNKLADEFIRRGEELAKFSGQISVASAMADVRSMQQDIKEANALSEPISQMIEAQSKTDQMMRDALLPMNQSLAKLGASWEEFKEGFVEQVVAPFLKFVGKIISGLASIGQDAIELLKKILEGVSFGLIKFQEKEDAELAKDKEKEFRFAWDALDSMMHGFRLIGGEVGNDQLERMRIRAAGRGAVGN